MKRVFLFLILSFIICLFQKSVLANNLIINSDFESDLQNWKINNSSVIAIITNEDFYQGSASAKIFNPKTSSYGIEQTLTDISSTLNYKISFWVKLIEPFAEKAFIRVAWYKSSDGSGSQFSTEDSPLATNSSSWQKLEMIKTPPEGINSAKIRLLTSSGSALFDEVIFEEYLNLPTIITSSPWPTETEPSPTTEKPTPTTFSPISYNNIFLSEAMVNPLTGEREWVEIYNNNDFEIYLSQWYLDDFENAGSLPKSFTLTLPAKSYGVIEISTSIFNNDGDQIRLLDFNKQLKDGFEYQSSEKGKTWARNSFEDELWCLQEPSKNQPNYGCQSQLTICPTSQENKQIFVANSLSQSNSQSTSPIITNKNLGKNSVIKKTGVLKINQSPNNSYFFNQAGEILGIATKKSQKNNFLLAKTLSLISLNYWLISLIILIKKVTIF